MPATPSPLPAPLPQTLDALGIGEQAEIACVDGEEGFRRRLLELGLAPGIAVRMVRAAPLGDPIEIEVRGYHLSLRRAEAARIALRAPGSTAPVHHLRRRSITPSATIRPPARSGPGRASRIALAGNPNTGKTTLFNALTGARAGVSNLPGTTVDVSRGTIKLADGGVVEVVDVPGTYSLNARSRDEQIAIDELLGRDGSGPPDAVVVLLNATALERSLYLLLQIREYCLPTLAVVNMLDEAEAQGIRIDLDEISRHFGVPCVGVVAAKRRGLGQLTERLDQLLRGEIEAPQQWHWDPPPALATRLDGLARAVGDAAGGDAPEPRRRAFALWCLMSLGEDDELVGIPQALRRRVLEVRGELMREGYDLDMDVIQARYEHIDEDAQQFIERPRQRQQADLSGRIDAVLTHPVGGLLIFLALMGLIFTAIFDWAAPLMDAIDAGFAALSVGLAALLPQGFLSALLAEGVVKGVGAVITFLPQILILLLLLTLLEGVGYMARAAFLMDRLMRKVGLHGRAFIPLISGYACAIPAVLATRTMEHRRDRLLTMAVIPLVTCSARLPVYTLIVATLLPAERKIAGPLSLGTVTMIGLYLLSTVLALVAAGVLGRTVLKGQQPPLLIELPPYRLPALRSVVLVLWRKVRAFLKTAGTVIVVASVIIWALLSYPKDLPLSRDYRSEIAAAQGAQRAHLQAARRAELLQQSYAGQLGQTIEPLLEPLGFDWKIGIGLIGAFAAREVFVATMGLVYGAGEGADEQSATLRQAMRGARHPDGSMVYTPLTALSLIVFFMIAMQCLSTFAIIRQESRSWRWPLFVLIYLNTLAYLATLLTCQVGRALGLG